MPSFAPVTSAENATPSDNAPIMTEVVATPVNLSSSYSKKAPVVAAVVESSSPVVTATVNKRIKNMAVGIGIKAPNGTPSISSIQADSLFATSALRVGMNIQSINNRSMSGKTARETASLIKEAVGEVTVVAGWNLSVSSPFITAPLASANVPSSR